MAHIVPPPEGGAIAGSAAAIAITIARGRRSR